MSNNTANSKNIKLSPARGFSVGLTRNTLSSAGTSRGPSSTGGATLTSPSRVNLAARTNSERRYQSAYTRLGGLRNVSDPNINVLARNVSDPNIKTLAKDGSFSARGEPTDQPDGSVDKATPTRYGTRTPRQLNLRDRYERGIPNADGGAIAEHDEPTNKIVTRIAVGVDRAESLKDEYLSHRVNSLADSKSQSAEDIQRPGRRHQPSVTVTPRTIDISKPLYPGAGLGNIAPRQDTVTGSASSAQVNPVPEPLRKSLRDTGESQKVELHESQPHREKVSDKFTINDKSTHSSCTDKPVGISSDTINANQSVYKPKEYDDTCTAGATKACDMDEDNDAIQPNQRYETDVGIYGAKNDQSSGVTTPKLGEIVTESPQTPGRMSEWPKSPMDDTPIAMPRSRRKITKRTLSFRKVEEDEYIGFSSLPEQVHRKAVRRGFEFTLMVVGETGLGKSTLINSLFLTDLYKDRKVGNTDERVHKTVDLEKKELEIEERGVKLKLTIVDTPGFNDAVNAEESWKPIVNYIDKQFETYFKAESGLNRKNIVDTRVHCCLYFISPYGHGLRPVDVSVMKKLHHKVNIVPLIAKADMLTKKEVKLLKEKVLNEIERHNIQIYQFPDCDSDEDEDFKQQDSELKKAIPFAVVGSNTVVEAGGKKIRGRMYPWGIVEVENPQHCDFVKLRQMLISTHMQDLKDVTCDIHYENYRAEHIAEQMTTHQKERNKLKRDSTPNLDKALDTERLLVEKEAEIKRMQEMLAKMQAQLGSKNSPQMNGKIGAK